jgi:hypothetical protein
MKAAQANTERPLETQPELSRSLNALDAEEIEEQLDPRLKKAVEIAEQRARPKSTNWCWRYVKKALLKSEAVRKYPGTRYAKQAGGELKAHGFVKLDIEDPYDAPVGSVIVYGGNGPGHVELKTEDGFVSDFKTPKRSKRPLSGVWVKLKNDAATTATRTGVRLAMRDTEEEQTRAIRDATPRARRFR